MSDIIRILIDVVQFLWPFRLVHQWQQGVYYICGRQMWTVGVGCWPVIPFFMDVATVNMVPAVYSTPLQTITVRDGRALTFSATLTVQVVDAGKALNSLDNWPETTVELVSGLLSSGLADAEVVRFDPARGKRDRLLDDLRKEADETMLVYGVTIIGLRLNNFAFVKTFRLMAESATIPTKPSIF